MDDEWLEGSIEFRMEFDGPSGHATPPVPPPPSPPPLPHAPTWTPADRWPHVPPYPPSIDPQVLARAWCLHREAEALIARRARKQRWPPMGSLRFLLLALLCHSTPYGLSVRRLAHMLRVKPSTLAYHLDALESAGFIVRAPWEIYDERKVAIRLTSRGRHALDHLGGEAPFPNQPAMRSPAIASP